MRLETTTYMRCTSSRIFPCGSLRSERGQITMRSGSFSSLVLEPSFLTLKTANVLASAGRLGRLTQSQPPY